MTKSKNKKVVNISYKHTDSSERDIENPSSNIPFFALRASARQLRKVDACKNSVKKGYHKIHPRDKMYT